MQEIMPQEFRDAPAHMKEFTVEDERVARLTNPVLHTSCW
jgi:hypothetical protein